MGSLLHLHQKHNFVFYPMLDIQINKFFKKIKTEKYGHFLFKTF